MYVLQPEGFVDQTKPDHVYVLDIVLYKLKQAPRAWYDKLFEYLLRSSFKKGKIDTTLLGNQVGVVIQPLSMLVIPRFNTSF